MPNRKRAAATAACVIAVLAAVAVAVALHPWSPEAPQGGAPGREAAPTAGQPADEEGAAGEGAEAEKEGVTGDGAGVAAAEWTGRRADDGTPLPFPELERPTSEMARNEDGTIEVDNGWTVFGDELWVYFDDRGESEGKMREIVSEYGFSPVDDTEYWHKSLDCGELCATIPPGMTLEEAAVVLYGVEGVESIELSTINHGHIKLFNDEVDPEETPQEDERAAIFPGIDLGEYHLAWCRFDEAWETAKCDGRVTVAVLDTGAPASSLADLAPNIDYDRAYDATGGDGFDSAGHGTAVASIISAVAGNDGCTGCSWNARILPIRIVSGDEFERGENGRYNMEPLWRAFDYLVDLESAPDVINMSFGAEVSEGGILQSDADRMQRYVSDLRERGCVLVAAAGNDGGFDVEHPFNGDANNSRNYPAACEGVISVGALHAPVTKVPLDSFEGWTSGMWLAGFSNTASDVDIVAFGDDIQALSLNVLGIAGTSKYDGTSFSAPQVAAAAALVKRAHPGYAADDVERALFETAVHPGDFDDAENADGRDDLGRYGYGALDAAAAVLWSDQRNPDPSRPGAGGGWSPTAGGNLAEMYRAEREGE